MNPANPAHTVNPANSERAVNAVHPAHTPERTQQQLDPAASVGARIPAVVLCVVAVIWAALEIAQVHAERDALALQLLTLGLLLGAAVIIVVASAPSLAPFTRREHATVHLLALSAFLVDLIAAWGTARTPWDASIAGCLGLFLIALSPYRPARELALLGTASAVVIASFTFLGAQAAPTGNGGTALTLLLVLSAVLPVLACGYGAARHSAGTVRGFLAWRQERDGTIAAESELARAGIYRAVHLERARELAPDVTPLLSDILYQENITADHRTRARAIAARIRSGLVADVDRTWLQTALAPPATLAGSSPRVDDPDGLASRMDRAQRTALHALIMCVMDDPSTAELSIALRGDDEASFATIAVGFGHTRSRWSPRGTRSTRSARSGRSPGRPRGTRSARGPEHARYDPFLAELRAAVTGLTAEFSSRGLTVKFSYAHR
ncbi:hypothetical protein B0I08_1123 [Glaciihabitans tibetensis]|uniref:Uncharacterized protein n=1 Tax=Glaciihabitans tibetensis TaxID=1266600 RepID=A0A2T0V355_9MICO|nr:hypothetical protein B0I08_1123 [Glaciihabitans tibetensis]